MNLKIITAFTLFLFLFTGCSFTADQDVDNIIHTVDSNSTLDDFNGRPSVILFGSTTCVHCQKAMPMFKDKVYTEYKDELNIWINVIDKKEFPIKDIPQGFNSNLDFEEITGHKCGYIPSWVVLDDELSVVMSSCGGERELSEMLESIGELI